MNDADRIEACRRALEANCRGSGVFITGDGRIAEEDAAVLLGFSVKTMQNKRQDGSAAVWFGGRGRRVTYRLADLAAWIESGRVDPRQTVSRNYPQLPFQDC